jgi:hypothetical protein
MRRNWVIRGLGFVLIAVLFVTAVGAIVMLLWNCCCRRFRPARDGFWEALGLLVLARVSSGASGAEVVGTGAGGIGCTSAGRK